MSKSALPFLALAVVSLVGRDVEAADRVAVLELVSNPPGLVSDLVLSSLSDEARRAAVDVLPTSQYSVITKENQEMVLRENGVDAAKLCEAECEVDVARTIGAALLVTGAVTKIGTKLSLHLKLFHAERGQVLKIVKVSGVDEGELYERVYEDSVRMFKEGLGIDASDAEQTSPIAANPLNSAPARRAMTGTARVTFRTEPSGARVIVDGAVACESTPCEASLPRQRVFATIEAPDHEPARVEVNPIDGMVVQKALELSAAEIVFPDHTMLGSVTVDDNVIVLRSNVMRVAPGMHRIVVGEDGCTLGGTLDVELVKGERFDASSLAAPKMTAVDIRVLYRGKPVENAEYSVDAGPKQAVVREPVQIPVCSRQVTTYHPTRGARVVDVGIFDGQNAPIEVEYYDPTSRSESSANLGNMLWNVANIVVSAAMLVPYFWIFPFAASFLAVGVTLTYLVPSIGSNSTMIAGGAAIAFTGGGILLALTGVVWASLAMFGGNETPSVGGLCIPCAPLGAWLYFNE